MVSQTARAQPYRCSAVYRRHVGLGATMGEYHGWRTAMRFDSAEREQWRVREGVGLADVSWLGKLDVRHAEQEWGGISDGISAAFGESPAGDAGATAAVPRRAWQLARGHAMVTCGPEEREYMAGAAAVSGNHVTDVTSVYGALLLAGPRGRDVLHKLTDLDVSPSAMPNETAGQGGLAHVHAVVLRADLGDVSAYWLLVGREYGEYVWDAVTHAGGEHNIVSFGMDALDALAPRRAAR